MTNSTKSNQIPRPGMLATVRSRRGTVTAIYLFDGDTGRLHLVQLDYQDGEPPSAWAACEERRAPNARMTIGR